MSSSTTLRPARRTMLRAAAAALGVGAVGAIAQPADAAAAQGDTPSGPLRVRERLQLVDRWRQQRFRLSSTKPPIFINGKTYPASARQGPEHGSYVTFNDENQSEKGGLTASSSGVSLSFDYPNTQALTLDTYYEGALGSAQLSMNEMPDPSIPIEDVTIEDAPLRVLLGCDNAGDGALLWLNDSAGRTRIKLQVDGDDTPRIQILDGDGQVVAQLPPQSPPARPSRGLLNRLRPNTRL